jgi:hypothetical protein
MRSPAWRSLKGLILLLPFLLVATVAQAGNREKQERAAKKACLSGDHAKGVSILSDLYVDTNDPTYLFNGGRCLEQNGQYEGAILRFREYLRKAKDANEAEKADAQKHIVDCQALLGKKHEGSATTVESTKSEPTIDPAVQAGCQKDTDCSGDLVCNLGRCAALEGSTQSDQPNKNAVPTRFLLTKAGGHFSVRSAETGEKCPIPCTLQLSPGFQHLEVQGDDSASSGIVVPAGGGDFTLGYKAAPQLYWGIGVAGLGTATLIAAIIIKSEVHGGGWEESGWLEMGGTGAAIMIVGGVLILSGFKQLEVVPASPFAVSPPAHKTLAPQFAIVPTRNGAHVGASVQF